MSENRDEGVFSKILSSAILLAISFMIVSLPIKVYGSMNRSKEKAEIELHEAITDNGDNLFISDNPPKSIEVVDIFGYTMKITAIMEGGEVKRFKYEGDEMKDLLVYEKKFQRANLKRGLMIPTIIVAFTVAIAGLSSIVGDIWLTDNKAEDNEGESESKREEA